MKTETVPSLSPSQRKITGRPKLSVSEADPVNQLNYVNNSNYFNVKIIVSN